MRTADERSFIGSQISEAGLRTSIGARLKHIRAGWTQPEMAERLGVAPRTYAGYERGERELGAWCLYALVQMGWNANWVLAGDGPERVDGMYDVGRDGRPGTEWSSSERQMEAMTLAVQEVDQLEATQRRRWSAARKARAYVLLAEILADPSDELPKADIVTLASRIGGEMPD